MESNPSSNYRAVLIGIDDYTQRPLNGCVNDIDQIEGILLDRLGVPPERITRFAAPRSGAASTTRLPSLSPTRDELRNFLNRLAEEVGPDDLVFLYYSGHGSRVDDPGERTPHRPRGAGPPRLLERRRAPQRLLYDFELNCLLARIAGRAGDLTVVLDCCHSASAARGAGTAPRSPISRTSPRAPGRGPGQGHCGAAAGLIPMLVAACQRRSARLPRGPGAGGLLERERAPAPAPDLRLRAQRPARPHRRTRRRSDGGPRLLSLRERRPGRGRTSCGDLRGSAPFVRSPSRRKPGQGRLGDGIRRRRAHAGRGLPGERERL